MFKIIFFLFCVPLLSASDKVNSLVINKNVDRSIDLQSQLVKISASITLENTGREAVKSFLIAEEPNSVGILSYINVKDSSKSNLKISSAEVDQHKGKFYNAFLSHALEPGRTTTVYLEEVYTKSLVPYPHSIAQKDKQLVRYFGNHYFFSPYVTNKQKTEVTLNSKNVESYTKVKPVVHSDSTITYGPYNTIQPFTEDQMIVHYENNAPFLTVTRLERSIELSHWGNIAVEENIEILHTGAKLKGPFSRYDYQRDTGSTHHSIKSYRTILPATAHSIYYRDSNGNISTSSVRPRKEWMELELRPRFPLFGGWRSSYILGYSVPSYQYLFKKPSGQYVLKMRLMDHVYDDMQVDELETSIVLPVGVTNVEIMTPYNVERLPDGVRYKYLDNRGRQVIRLRKTNLVEQHIQDLEITYDWTQTLLLHEPILVSIALFLLFIVVIIYVRLDFSLNKSEHSKKD